MSARELTALIHAARSVHPNLAVSDDEFASFVAFRLDRGELDDESALRNAADLLLVCAVLAGDPTALDLIDRDVIASQQYSMARIVGAAAVEDAKQRVREALVVVPPGGAAGISRYAGRGSLRGWVRAVAIRTAIKVRDEHPGAEPLDFDILGPNDDPTLRILRQHHAPEFRVAFEVALRKLPPRERTLLRQQFVDDVGIDELSRLHGVHRVTMYRRLVKIRRQVLSEIRRELRKRLALEHSELDSIMRAFENNIELSLERILATESP